MSAESYLTQVYAPGSESADAVTWNPLRLFNLYRLTLAGLLTFLCLVEKAPPPLGTYDADLFYWGCAAWLGSGLLFGIGIRARIPSFYVQVFAQVAVDIIMLTVLMHASGGIKSGLGMLLVISVASGSLLTVGRTAGIFGAAATLAVLAEQVYSAVRETGLIVNFPQAGLLGATLFATAALAHTLARRIRETEALAEQRSVDLANMAELTRYIVQQVQVGVIAVDRQNRVRLMNASAWALLGRPQLIEQEQPLDTLASGVAAALERWRDGQWEQKAPVRLSRHTDASVRFSGIGTGQYAGTVIFLEDASNSARQVQQLKLAAVGRLTASIAHEIRNPLGAISHAGQLLGESSALEKADRRLVEIILGHSRRMNEIIESILQLSRRDHSQPVAFALGLWLARFRDDFIVGQHTSLKSIVLEVNPADLTVRFDPLHLQQIVTNLCKNAIEHTEGRADPRVRIRAGLSETTGLPFLEVLDNGPGISGDVQARLFEPFVSTRPGGTGLGLYISRELAECNHAELEYVPQPGGGCFRLSMSDIETHGNE